MNNLSYSDERAARSGARDDVQPGDLVRTGANAYPQFEVIAVRGDKAWVRDVLSGAEQIVMRAGCHRIRSAGQ